MFRPIKYSHKWVNYLRIERYHYCGQSSKYSILIVLINHLEHSFGSNSPTANHELMIMVSDVHVDLHRKETKKRVFNDDALDFAFDCDLLETIPA